MIQMSILTLIYNGHIELARRSTLISEPTRAAWVFCTISIIMYALAAFSWLSVVAADFIEALPFSERQIQIAIIILLVILSDIRLTNRWFGVESVELTEKDRKLAESVALIFSIGSYIVFMVVNINLFTKF